MEENVGWQEYCFKPENTLSGNAIRLLKNGDEAFAETLKVLRAAKEYILLEFYCFADDSVGRMFKDLLVEKVSQGVSVYLIYDSVGSILTDKDFFSAMTAGGIRVGEFRPVVLWKPSSPKCRKSTVTWWRSWMRRRSSPPACSRSTRL